MIQVFPRHTGAEWILILLLILFLLILPILTIIFYMKNRELEEEVKTLTEEKHELITNFSQQLKSKSVVV